LDKKYAAIAIILVASLLIFGCASNRLVNKNGRLNNATMSTLEKQIAQRWSLMFGKMKEANKDIMAELQLQNYSSMIDLNSSNAGAYASRADLEMNMGNYTGALGDYNRLIEMDPSNGTLYNSRGLIQLLLGNEGQAMQDVALSQNLTTGMPDYEALKRIAEQIKAQNQSSAESGLNGQG
jgi:tetratricopeptide (TPR) repeat protein